MKTIPSVLGVSRKFNFLMNSVTVPRKPGEAMGAICKLVD
jgi:UDP-sugar pyrophosphorylase